MNYKMNKSIILLILFLLSVELVKAHNGHPHSDTSSVTLPVGINEFPTLHPLIVHFPIALLIAASLLQFFSLRKKQKELHVIIVFLTVCGTAGGFLASYNFHPHTVALSPVASDLLKKHELYATITIWLAGGAALLKIFTLYRKKKSMEIITTLLLLASAVTISITGHHGAELVHKFGIGPKGNYLENHNP